MSQVNRLRTALDVESARWRAEDVSAASLEYFGGDELAASTFTSKYALKLSTDEGFRFAERTPADMHDRLAREFARVDAKYPGSHPVEEFRRAIDGFRHIVPQGSPMYGIGNPFVRVSISNCVVVQSPPDNISGIMETGKDLANLFKRRCGVGLDISTLRPEGATVSNAAGTSTGAWSFADYFSHVCRMIGQNGRRGALMITLDVRHPDIQKFVTMKRDLSKVTGANVSVMLTDEFMRAVERDQDWVCHWPVDRPVEEARVTNSLPARELWHLINESAVLCAEPGLLFWDNYLKNLPAECYPDFKTICVNPCSEIGLSAYDSCRLMTENLKGYVREPFTARAWFDFESFERDTRLAMRMMDDMVDLEIEYLSSIIEFVDEEEEKSLWTKLRQAATNGRRTGLGCHGLADALACMEMRYDGPEALSLVDRIFSTFRDAAYDESVNLAIERGPFPSFNWELEKDCDFIKRLPQGIQDRIARHGRRNISILTMAPTGSVSILSQTSSGIEPVFMNFYTRRKKVNPSDPGVRVDFTDQNGDRWEEFPVFHHNVMHYLEAHPEKMALWNRIRMEENSSQWAERISELLPDYFVTSMEIDPHRRVEIQGVIQKYIDHGISSTINMPRGTTIEQGQELYEMAWKHGLKGVTIYVDGSRSGVLVSASESSSAESGTTSHPEAGTADPDDELPATVTPAAASELIELTSPVEGAQPIVQDIHPHASAVQPRPRRLMGATYRIQTPVGKAYVTINDTDDAPFEVFVTVAKAGSTVAADADAMGRLCSLALRMAAPNARVETAQEIVRQLEGIGGERTTGFGAQRVRSIADAVAQVIREHVAEGSQRSRPAASQQLPAALSARLDTSPLTAVRAGGTAAPTSTPTETELPFGDVCPECGHATLVHENGCNKCYSCGFGDC